jgi:hypothetical protein
VGLSADGTLLVAGCNERLLAVIDAARPQIGPLAQVRDYGQLLLVTNPTLCNAN